MFWYMSRIVRVAIYYFASPIITYIYVPSLVLLMCVLHTAPMFVFATVASGMLGTFNMFPLARMRHATFVRTV